MNKLQSIDTETRRNGDTRPVRVLRFSAFLRVLFIIAFCSAIVFLASAAVAQDKSAAEQPDIQTLRRDIAAQTNDYERVGLQLKLVDLLVNKGMQQQAIAELQAFSLEERFNPAGFYNIANAQARLGDSEGAVKTYRKAIEQRKGRYSRAFNNLGVVLMRLGQWDEAYEAFVAALRLESFRYAEASYNLGRLYAARGETDLAIREWRRALAIDPDHSAAANSIANASSMGKITVIPRAARSDERSPSRPGTVDATSENTDNETRFSLRPGKPFAVDPETYNFLQRARTAREHGRHVDAIEQYRRVIARMGGYFAPANLELSYSLIALKRNDEAMASLLPVSLKDGERFPISYYHVARIYELRGELKLAEENFSRAAAAYGDDNSQFLLDLSRVREKLGNATGALESLEKYLEIANRQGHKPIWSTERLAALRLKATQAPR